MSSKVLYEITYPFPNFNGFIVEVLECIIYFNLHLIMDVKRTICLHNGISFTSETISLYWIGTQAISICMFHLFFLHVHVRLNAKDLQKLAPGKKCSRTHDFEFHRFKTIHWDQRSWSCLLGLLSECLQHHGHDSNESNKKRQIQSKWHCT